MPSSHPRAPASPTATLPPCWPRPPRARICWRWRHSRPSSPACRYVVTREPAMGEIRLQWWRDALALPDAGTRTGNPDRRCGARRRRTAAPAGRRCCSTDRRTPTRPRRASPCRTTLRLRTYLWKSEGPCSPWRRGVLGVAGPAPTCRRAAAACGRAYGLARLLLGLPQALSRGRLPLPQSRLDAAGVTQSGAAGRRRRRPGVARSACGLAAQKRAKSCHEPATCGEFAARDAGGLPSFGLGRDVSAGAGTAGPRCACATPAEIAPLTRVCRIAAAHWFGRI